MAEGSNSTSLVGPNAANQYVPRLVQELCDGVDALDSLGQVVRLARRPGAPRATATGGYLPGLNSKRKTISLATG